MVEKGEKMSVEKYIEENTFVQDQIDDIILELIKERKKNNISQTELSKRAKVPQTTISRMESFRTVPTIQVLIRISNAMGKTLFVK